MVSVSKQTWPKERRGPVLRRRFTSKIMSWIARKTVNAMALRVIRARGLCTPKAHPIGRTNTDKTSEIGSLLRRKEGVVFFHPNTGVRAANKRIMTRN